MTRLLARTLSRVARWSDDAAVWLVKRAARDGRNVEPPK